MGNRSPTTNHQPPDYYTLADLLGHFDNGEMTLEEAIARWPHEGKTNEELLREILEMLLKQQLQIGVLKRRLGG